MKQYITFLFVFCFLFILSPRLQAQCFDCGNGSEGAFNAVSNTTLSSGAHNYTSFTIAPGVVVRVTGTQNLNIKVRGIVNIQGTLDVSGINGVDAVTFSNAGTGGIGVAGGGNGGDGSFHPSTGPIDGFLGTGPGLGGIGMAWTGGGGAGYALAGGNSGGTGGYGGPVYGTIQIAGNTAGSGGGGGSGGNNCGGGGGGAGGGYVYIGACGNINISGIITANGGNGGSDGTGNCGGGGGGSGGSIWLAADTITNSGLITATGGTGGASMVAGPPYFGAGATGSEGRIRMDRTVSNGTGTTNPAVGFVGTLFQLNIQISNITNITCHGFSNGRATANVSGAVGPYTLLWCNGISSASVSGLTVGCCSVSVTDSSGCTVVDSVCITEPPAIVATTNGSALLCFGDCDGNANVQVSGGTPGYGYLWSTSDTTDSVSGLCAGSYNVRITDMNGCVDSVSSIVTQPAAIALSETHVNESAPSASDGSATVTAGGGTPGYSYLWSPGNDTTATINNLSTGTYTVEVTDSNGCTDTLSVVITTLVGVSDLKEMNLEIFPNPTRGEVFLKIFAPTSGWLDVSVFETSGKKVFKNEYAVSGDFQTKLDLDELAQGLYILQITLNHQVIERKISILK